ncbi:MAG: DMT family transporter [Acidimicrobiales bacterium]
MNETTRRSTLGLSASALAATLWGFGGIFAVLTFASGLVVAFYRLWLGAALLTIVSYAVGQRLSWATLRHTWLGGVFLAGDMMLFYCAVRLTSIVDVTVIGAFQPALMLIAARKMFGERLGRWDVAWIVVAMAGVTIAVLGPSPAAHHRLAGDLLSVGALVSFSGYWIVSKRAREHTQAMEYTAGVTIMAAAVTTVVVLASSQALGRIHPADWGWIVLLAIVPGSGHLIMNWAHRFVDASVSSAISCLAPLVAAVVAIPILGQSLSVLQVVGELIGLAAIAVVAARNRQPVEPLADSVSSAD